ncbi:carbohydrate esterase family 10 protein [Ceratobasidium sp. AG-Ba]|nr:carbohydrate esterase family 10 protein [Ceratobasidium sp. AG-Ba]
MRTSTYTALWFASAVLGAYVPSTNSSGPVVKLPYARYEGFHNETTGLDVFLGIRYAKPPTGNLRWKAPKTPGTSNGILKAISQPAKCPQLNILSGGNTSTPGVPDPTEDCLFLNVFSPPPSSHKKKLPVLVWVHGGGYFAGFAAAFDPTAMIKASNDSFVAVIIQYRLGMFGFLAGDKIKKNGDLNAGLLDVQFALKWTQQNIHLWGGDPGRVTLWGESAGAGAVLMQVVANGGKTNPQLFKRSIASSPYVPPNYRYNDAVPEAQYTQLVNRTGCANSTDTLSCLRGLDYPTLASAAASIIDPLPRPVVDGKFLRQRPELSLARKQVNGNPCFTSHNVDEGFIFLTPNPNSTVTSYLQSMLPKLSEQNITAISNAYKVFSSSSATAEANTFANQVALFGEGVFVCPSLWLAEAFPKKGHQGLFAIPPSYHSEDLGVYFPGTSAAEPAQPFTESVTQSFMGALVSFILTGSPNNNRLNKTINPHWNTYNSKSPQGMTFNITSDGTADPKYEAVNSGILERCKLWRSLAPYTPQ